MNAAWLCNYSYFVVVRGVVLCEGLKKTAQVGLGVRFLSSDLLVVRTVLITVLRFFPQTCDPLIVIVLSRVCPILSGLFCSGPVVSNNDKLRQTSIKQKKHQEHQNRSSNTREQEQPPTREHSSLF
jgi:hypothetical protein